MWTPAAFAYTSNGVSKESAARRRWPLSMTDAQTLRDLILARLKKEFGEPLKIDQNFRWSIDVDGGQRPINIAMDCWRTPQRVRVWLFDPRSTTPAGGVLSFLVHEQAQIDAMVHWLHHCITANGPDANSDLDSSDF